MIPTPNDLLNEIENGPLSSELVQLKAEKNAAAIHSLLNTSNRSFQQPVRISVLSSYCLTNGITGKIRALNKLPVTELPGSNLDEKLQMSTLLSQVLTIMDDYRLGTADLNDPATLPLLNGMEALNLITSTQRTELLALSNATRSRCDELGWVVTRDLIDLVV